MEKLEQAFLAWLNSFGVEKEGLSDITVLKNGIFLQKLLMIIDPNAFSFEGFSLEADHWSLYLSNLQKLTDGIKKYCRTYLNMKLPDNYVDISSIARKSDKEQILRLVFV